MTDRRLLGFVPQGSDSLLIQAAIAPAERARAAWQAWTAQRPLDEASWAEVRMLPSVAARAAELAIAADLLPRLDGIRRFVWAGSQKQMLAARPILAHLVGHGVPVMLLKGAALTAAYPAAMGRRFLRDVDILVPADRVAEAAGLIAEAGWRNPFYPDLEPALLLGLARTHALAFQGGAKGEIDLHRFALAPNFCAGDDDELWARARAVEFLGLSCRVPAAEDLLVTTLEHSFRRDPDQVLDWTLDAARLIGDPALDWGRVVETTIRRNLAVPVEARLRYLAERCGLAVPDQALASLAPHSRDPVFVAESLANHLDAVKSEGEVRRALVRAQRRRAEAAGRVPAPSPAAGLPEVRQSAGGRRIDVRLPLADIRAVRVDIEDCADPAMAWRCRVHCGVIFLRRLVGGNGLRARIERLWQRHIPIERAWFDAQATGDLTLYIHPKVSDRDATPAFTVDCATERRGGLLVIRLRFGRP
ncbi:MAG: nucleotidyltransferase family protein [Thiobacillus sp.]|nr:nucleotidyltransferase family protein [Thiobacillus sp.]